MIDPERCRVGLLEAMDDFDSLRGDAAELVHDGKNLQTHLYKGRRKNTEIEKTTINLEYRDSQKGYK